MKTMTLKDSLIAVICATALVTSGCASTDQQNTENQGTAAGVVIGGLLGLALGDSKEATLLGATVGAVLGNMYGKHVADKKAEYKDTEAYMTAMIAESDKVIAASREQRETLQSSVTNQKQMIASYKQKSAEQQDLKKALSEQLEKNAKDLETTNELIAAIDREVGIQQRVLNEERAQLASVMIDKSEANITTMESEKRQLQLLKTQLASLDYRRVY
ncbi:glycine zipper domain-containing protein [Alteromonas macleodii]|uniref:glycine zipper domain-containing protein n=1 Tax=Alteromonas macleodii TaxID=28108 RepID=UPI0020768941|nr:glycine zipper domain-containing protein [Alteromonas macleodii]USI27918.1 glycine zipper domain-containing protein [Alteromonas macleodii]